jgi:DNA polymerase
MKISDLKSFQPFLPQQAVAMISSKQYQLEALQQRFKHCQNCSLAAYRQNLVFGEGNPESEVIFIGEGPGEEEDLQGRPFVGRSGKLLDRMLAAIGLDRSSIYIANTVKCRPPNNRTPKPEELQACSPLLLEQISIIEPKFLVTLGTSATRSLLQMHDPISQIRGNWYDYPLIPQIKVLPSFHPAYLLRNPSAKKASWHDLQLLASELKKSPNQKTSPSDQKKAKA